MKRTALVAVTATLLATATAASATAATQHRPVGSAPPASAEPCPEGDDDSLRVTNGTVPRSLDPLTNSGSASAGGTEITAIYDTLLRFNPDTGEYEPGLAESFESNADSTEWTITLREGLTFANGDPLTTDAVRYSITRMQESTTNSGPLAATVSEMAIVDERTIVFTLGEPWGTFPYALSEEAGMVLNPAIVDAMEVEEFGLLPPVGAGAGPYQVESWTPGEELVMRANESYWGGTPCIEELRFTHIPAGDQVRIDAFRSGEVDMAFATDPRILAATEAEGVEVVAKPSGLGVLLLFNVGLAAGSPTHDIRVREAIQLALDYDVLNERVFGGAAEATSAIMPADSPIYGGEGPAHDPERAAALVAEAKADGWDGTLEVLGSTTPIHQELTLALEALLESVGFDVTIETVPPADLLTQITADQSFQVALHGPVVFEETTVADVGYFEGGSPANRAGTADPGIDAAADALRAATNREETQAAMEQLQAAWNEVFPSANIFMSPWWWAMPDDIEGITFTRDTVPLFGGARFS